MEITQASDHSTCSILVLSCCSYMLPRIPLIFTFWLLANAIQFSSVQLLSCVRLFVTPWIAALQASCPSPTPRVHSNSSPSSQWCHPAISSSVVPFSSCPQSIPASGSFPMSQLFAWGGQSMSFSFSINTSNEHPGLISFRMDWLDLLAVQANTVRNFKYVKINYFCFLCELRVRKHTFF